ncbi:hypothetical protein ERJ75_001743100 [Trypanosoma vivax]|uniref:Uncharacterized protein n=1 Tax=Trypanosoma vivax (strain Y486) TaxID=1055687 RepID=G0U2T3_TRYVY|nr:hypothetical protein TRVL_06478 [Trypanosoma vivax]KAH8604173.1 hypothetical protein ERJ75_001743100 [Trypanosoma vivax]CCC50587.1 conserved hypothetical protein [Trypanosoma vivax Y486]
MLDHLFALGIAFVGLVVVYSLFRSIRSTDVVVATTEKPQRVQRKAKKAQTNKKENELELELNELIAREVNNQTASMRSDTRVTQPKLLENIQRDAAGRKNREQTTVPEKQMKVDLESGFQPVASQPKQRPQPKQVVKEQVDVDEELERKLSLFFSKTNRKEKKEFVPKTQDQQPSKGSGVSVIVKKNISNARTW